jgi:GT2 family glycosyltransferase
VQRQRRHFRGQTMSASVVLVNHNHKDAILHCLESVLGALPAECEVIVVDNASSDGSSSAIRAAFPLVSLIAATANGGFGAGCNLGARKALGTHLVFLNPDTTVTPHWLDSLLAPFEAHPRTGLTTARILLADGSQRINVCGIDVHISGLCLMRGMGRSGDALPQPELVASVSGAAFAVRREVFDSLGGFDEEMFLYMEDVDLSWRARLGGWDCEYAPASVVYHDYSLKLRPGRIFEQERNRYLMLLKTLRWPTLLLLLPIMALAELVTAGFVAVQGLSLREKVAAFRWVIAHWRAVLEKRRAVQKRRAVPDRELLRRTVGPLAFYQTASPVVSIAARLLFNPLFSIWRWLLLALVWW